VQELYEVQIVPGMRRATMRMPHEDLNRQAISVPNRPLWAKLSADDARHAARQVGATAPASPPPTGSGPEAAAAESSAGVGG
jgi:hypothetical protein